MIKNGIDLRTDKGIIVTTSEATKDFLRPCLESIMATEYPIEIVSNGGYIPDLSYMRKTNWHLAVNEWNGFELGGIMRGKEDSVEFIHLMDTCVVKDIALFDKLFEIPGHVFLTHGGYHYMGKFVSANLPPIPKIETKADAISMELTWLGPRARSYFKPDLPVHTDKFEVKHGSKRMVLENDFLIKWKGTWSL